MQSYRITVSGMVQGVFFRASTIDFVRNESLTISGYVRNLPNGKVEILAQGNEIEVKKLSLWLKNGPQSARVDETIVEKIEIDVKYKDFSVKY
ncbi:MAG: acylphosphatase [Bacteriovoracaceae bacterium]|nr:acylphosphatase [Bacteriovoracaceae bacterium]